MLKTITAESKPGPFLNVNEDAQDFDTYKKIYMVLDGFGGSGIGDKAVTDLKQQIKAEYGASQKDLDKTLSFFYSPRYLLEANILLNLLHKYNYELWLQNQNLSITQRAGAAGIFMVESEKVLSLCSIGNCRSFLIRDGAIFPLSLSDSTAMFSSVGHSSKGQLPLSGIGLFKHPNFQVTEVSLKNDDIIIALTDGAFSHLQDEEIKSLVLNYRKSAKQRVVDLFTLANKRGNLDNQTILLLEY